MCFEKTRTVTEDVSFDAHEIGFDCTLKNGNFSLIKISDAHVYIETNEESLREFHRKLGEVLKYVDEQRGVGKEVPADG